MSRGSAKDTVDGTRNLDVHYFQRHGLFSYATGFQYVMYWIRDEERVASISWLLEGCPGSPRSIRLKYTATHFSEKTDYDYSVQLDTTPCNYGGLRWWFICPLMKDGRPCRRRCRFLYLPLGGGYFGCRECYDLAYESSQKSGSFFYETMSRPFTVLERCEEKLQRVRSPEKRARLLTRMHWAQRRLSVLSAFTSPPE